MVWRRLEQKQLDIWKQSYWWNNLKEHALFIMIMFLIIKEYVQPFLCDYKYYKYSFPKRYPTWWLEERMPLAILFAIILIFIVADFIFRLYIKRKNFLMGVDIGIILYTDEKYGKFTIRIPKNLDWQLDTKSYDLNNINEDKVEESIFNRRDFTYYDYETYSYL